jgi:hypothetical protein
VGTWYTIGLFAGLGVALGVLLAGILGATRAGALATVALAAAGGVVLGALISGWPEAVGGGVGGLLGGSGAAQIVGGTLRRGGTRAGTAMLIALGALLIGLLAIVPAIGYVEAVVVPALAARLRRRAGRTYAGLRILARD